MFTGIVEELGEVVTVEHGAASAAVRIRGPLVTSDAGHRRLDRGQRGLPDRHLGRGRRLHRRRDAGDAAALEPRRPRPGSPVNLERPLTLPVRLGGHLVQGHVDATASDRAPDARRELGGGAVRAACRA